MDAYNPHDTSNRSSLVSALHFPVIPNVSLLWKRAESPLLQLLTVVRQFERPSEKHLPDSRWSLPSGTALLRYWQRGVQSMLEQRPMFGWDWKLQVRQLRDFLRMLPSRAELIAYRIMGPEASVASLAAPPPMELPDPLDSDIPDNDVPVRRSSSVAANLNGGVSEHRLKVCAFDAPITRMDNIRRSRVLSRLMDSGRSLV